jgi:hypothetical protein
MTTFDGLRLRMHSSRDDEALLAAFSAEYDPSLRDDVGASSGLESPESVQGEVANLAARFEGWLYELPEWRLDSLSRRREDLVEITSAGEQPQ